MLGSGVLLCEMNDISLEVIRYLEDRELMDSLGSNLTCSLIVGMLNIYTEP